MAAVAERVAFDAQYSDFRQIEHRYEEPPMLGNDKYEEEKEIWE